MAGRSFDLIVVNCVTALRELAEKPRVQFTAGHDAAVARSANSVEVVRTDTATYRAPKSS